METQEYCPKVSILIPVYNREHLVIETVLSALRQDYENFEIIVCDNASTDHTWEALNEHFGRETRVKLFRNKKNIGPVRNWMKCAKMASGEIYKILWSDDLIDRRFVSRTIIALSDPGVGFVYTSAGLFVREPSAKVAIYQRRSDAVIASDEFIKGSLSGVPHFPVSPGCAIFRAKDFESCLVATITSERLGDSAMHGVGPDLLLLLNIANKYKNIGYIKDMLSFFRIHEESITISSARSILRLRYAAAKAWFVLSQRPDMIFDVAATIFMLKFRYLSHSTKLRFSDAGYYPSPLNAIRLSLKIIVKTLLIIRYMVDRYMRSDP